MDISALGIPGAWLAESPLWRDNRGNFCEWFRLDAIETFTGRNFNVQQANVSQSSRGVLRGIHYSISESGQAKWITCVNGKIRDYVVDLRTSSATFGKWISVELSGTSGQALFIEEGLGHAFLSLEENTCISYLLSSPYSPDYEFGVNPFDTDIGIDWGLDFSVLKISERDKSAPSLHERIIQGKLPS